jgi:integrase
MLVIWLRKALFMSTLLRTDVTTVELLESFWLIHWDSYTPTSRSTRRGRLVVMAATMLDDPMAAKNVLAEVNRQNVKYGAARPDAKTVEAWAARYLLDFFLPAPEHTGVMRNEPSSAEIIEAAAWIRTHSKPARSITDEDLIRLRTYMGGQTYHTHRSYWAFIEKVIHWAIIAGHLQHDPTLGLPPIKRRLDEERVDPDRVPSEEEVWAIARAGGELRGEWFKVAVLLGTFGAMRIGELVALRRRHIRCVVQEGLWLTIDNQIRRYPRRYSDDGNTVTDFAPPKGRPTASGARRRCYVPTRVAQEILEYVDSRLPDQLLFPNTYGRPMSTVSFRESWNRVMNTEPVGPRLAGITPHVMRRTGMSLWLRQGLDLKLIQSWGGWHSLTVMLDTYAALLPGAEEDSIALLEGRRVPSRRRTSSQAMPQRQRSAQSRRSPSRRDGAIQG